MTDPAGPAGPSVRRYHPDDAAAVDDVCVRTGDAGGDARGLFGSDDLLPDLFARPYLRLAPELAFVVDDGGEVAGYVLGCADTAAFARAYREVWIPELAGRYPQPPAPASAPASASMSAWGREQALLDGHHHPERMVRPELAPYPAHLHVDLLPSHQGRGLGRALIATFMAAAATAGAAAVHLGVAASNARALGFYGRLGFRPIEVPGADPSVRFLGRPTR